MTVFYCRKCTTQLTPDLLALDAVPAHPDESDRDKKTNLLPSTVARGHYATAAENSVLVHPEDVASLEPSNWIGCCGPDGTHGPNMICSCGTRLATLFADCMSPYELHLDPVRVYAFNAT